MEAESFASVPLLVADRVVAALNVYRIGEQKSFSATEVAQIERFATMAALAFDSARQRDTLREQARTDGLTGLLNHRACHERLSEEVTRAAARDRPLSVVVLDLDHFKTINDAYGHGEGDKVLVAAAAKLRSAVREDDLVARLGGEEFALILPGVDGPRAAEAAERARAAIAEVGLGEGSLSCSAGVASYPEDERDAGRLLELADGALYWAKRSGRDQSRRYDRRLTGQLSATASAPRSRRCCRARTRSCRCSSRCWSSRPAASPATRRWRGCPRARSGRPTSGSTRRIAPGSARAGGRRPQGRPARARTARADVPRAQREPGALLSSEVARRCPTTSPAS